MNKVFNRRLKILFTVTAALLIMTVGLYAVNYIKQGIEITSTTTTVPDESLTTPPTTTEETTTEETTTEETTTTETTTEEPTTTKVVHHFSHLTIFLDVQRAVFFHTNEAGEAIPEVSLRVSTGLKKGSTPVTPPNKPFILSGYRANQLLFTKAETWVWVRYATHVTGDIFIHSQPYDHQKDSDGKTVPLDRSLASKWGYNRLGKYTASNGCIRMSLRDAQYLSQNIHRGMPCYIFASSKGYDLPEAPALPPANLSNRWDPTDPDPLNPYVHREQKSMAWKYVPKSQKIEVMMKEQPSAADGILNGKKLPKGTTFHFAWKPDTRAAGVFHTRVIVTYPDGSVEQVQTKIHVIDPANPPTTTPAPTPKPTTSTKPPATTPKPTPTTPKETTAPDATTTDPDSSSTTTSTTPDP